MPPKKQAAAKKDKSEDDKGIFSYTVLSNTNYGIVKFI